MDISKFEKAVAAAAEKMSVRAKHAWRQRLNARADAAEQAGNGQLAGLFSVAWMATL